MPMARRQCNRQPMANGRAAVSSQRRPMSSWWFTGALIVGLNLAAGILIWSVWEDRSISDLGPAAMLGLVAGVVLLVVGAVRAVLDSRAARRGARRVARHVSLFRLGHRPAPVVHRAAPLPAAARRAVVFEPATFTPAPATASAPTVERPVPGQPAGPAPAVVEGGVDPVSAPRPVRPAPVEQVETSRSLEAPAPPPPPPAPPPPLAPRRAEPAPVEVPSLTGLHSLGATMRARMFDHGLTSIEILAEVGDDEIEDLASDLGTFPGRLSEWVAEARAMLAAADPYMRSA